MTAVAAMFAASVDSDKKVFKKKQQLTDGTMVGTSNSTASSNSNHEAKSNN